jgi:hypothetical protein
LRGVTCLGTAVERARKIVDVPVGTKRDRSENEGMPKLSGIFADNAATVSARVSLVSSPSSTLSKGKTCASSTRTRSVSHHLCIWG